MAGLEEVEGQMGRLKLSAEEKKGVKIGWASGGQMGMIEPQAIGRLLSEKTAFSEGLSGALGRAWCPLKGIHCKAVGENIFLFTFYQPSGKRKALEEGPWMFDNDLLVMEDFDVNKSVDEYKFESFPIWVRIFNLPLGRMNRKTGEEMGEVIGEYIDVGTDAYGKAPGKFLRVNVRLQVVKPLLRGLMVTFGEDNKEKWCRFEYEFLPNFCFTCGKVGHIDKTCSIKLGKGETQQFGKWLKWTPNLRGSYSSERGSWSGRRGSENKKYGSDSLSWRKDKNTNGDYSGGGKGEEREMSSLLKLPDGTGVGFGRTEIATTGAGSNKQILSDQDKGQDGGSGGHVGKEVQVLQNQKETRGSVPANLLANSSMKPVVSHAGVEAIVGQLALPNVQQQLEDKDQAKKNDKVPGT
ncbi:hypothetical protein ACQ4PT_062581 [Festuca glaucescens]